MVSIVVLDCRYIRVVWLIGAKLNLVVLILAKLSIDSLHSIKVTFLGVLQNFDIVIITD